ncbi:cell division protein SepF [Faecalicatena contorta]|uniref:Cell division protein SepF n=1 Tax=Faecalicatena fissicatena TaxID=290055 RepID=A0ABS2E4S6_9FIRM|nr:MULTISPECIES: cell division protein SepF [Clostridia]MBM6684129.1 cell division protein SepF [Faecalicatena contorta]MBM6709559.1 cell division protein SepF [Faecalicatena contorta]MBM6736634.1 cell division protein SepF [Faecalicatena fissicatena]HIY00006.1 cell division protein SepF [Candidatus Dorea intestinigallinarum]
MGVLDKFLDIMKLSDDDDDYENDDFFDDDDYEDDDYEDRSSKKGGLLSKFNKGKDNSRDRDDDYDDYDDDYEERPARQSSSRSSHSSHQSGGSSKVTPMRQPSSRRQAPNMEVCVIKPSSVEDAREITETLLSGRTVILNLEGLDLEVAQRIIDFTSGATFAINGNLQKISNYIFLVTPTNVDISGDLQDLLGTSFDASSMRTRF